MQMTDLLLASHILLFGIALALTEGVSLFLQSVVRVSAADVTRLAGPAARLDRLGAGCWLLCAATGILLVVDLRLKFGQGWIVLSIALFIILAVNGILGHSRWLEALANSPDGKVSQRATRRKALANAVSMLIIPTLVFLMVAKPQ